MNSDNMVISEDVFKGLPKGNKNSLGVNISWNFLGKVFYAASRGAILIILAKLGTTEMVGQFALAFAITAPLFMLTDLNLRSVFSTDSKNELDFDYYFTLRVISAILCIVGIIGIAAMTSYDIRTVQVIFIVGLAKGFDTVTDMIYGVFQKFERMDIVGKSLIIKGVLSSVAVYVLMLLTRSLLAAVIAMSLSWLLVLIFYDYFNVIKFCKAGFVWDFKIYRHLVLVSLPLGMVLLFTSLNNNICSYFVQSMLGSEYLGYYSSILYIITVGDSITSALGQSACPRLAKYYAEGDRASFMSSALKLSGILLILSVIGLFIVGMWGGEILGLIYTNDYVALGDMFLLLMLSGTFLYQANFLNYAITSARLFKIQPVISGIVLLVSVALNYIFIKSYGINGASYASLITNILLFTGSFFVFGYSLTRVSKTQPVYKTMDLKKKLSIEVIENINELKKYEESWREILKENNNNIIFLDPDWINLWWENFGKEYLLHIVVVKEEDEAIGFCPLMIIKKTFYNEVYFIGEPQAIHMDILAYSINRNSVVEKIFEHLSAMKGNYIFKMSGFAAESKSFADICNYLKTGSFLKCISKVISPVIKINTDFESYYKERFSGRKQKNMRRTERRLAELAKYEVKELDKEEIDIIFSLHNDRWKKKLDTSEFSGESSKRFFAELANKTFKEFEVKIWGLYLKNRIIAFQLGFKYQGNYLFYRSAHDSVFSLYNPGLILKKEIINKCFNRDFNTNIISFGIGYEQYKKEWTDNNPEVVSLLFAKISIFGLMFFTSKTLKLKLKEFIKKYYFIVRFKRNTLGYFKYFISKQNLIEHINKYREQAKKYGNLGLVKKCSKGFIKALYYRKDVKVFVKNLDSYLTNIRNNEYKTTCADLDEANEVASLMECPMEEVVNRFYRMNKCLVTKADNKIIAYSWLLIGESLTVESKEVKTDATSGFIYDYFIEPVYNKSNIRELILSGILDYLKGLSIGTAILVSANNDTYLEIAGKALDFIPWKYYTVHNICKRYHISFNNILSDSDWEFYIR